MAGTDRDAGIQLFIPRGVLADLAAHALAAAPRECCGLLIGTGRRIVESARTENLESGATRFLVDPAAHFALMKRLRGSSLEIVGAYHSHPRSAAVPSATDIAEAVSGQFLCVIVSLLTPDEPVTRAYYLRDGTAHELEVVAADAND